MHNMFMVYIQWIAYLYSTFLSQYTERASHIELLDSRTPTALLCVMRFIYKEIYTRVWMRQTHMSVMVAGHRANPTCVACIIERRRAHIYSFRTWRARFYEFRSNTIDKDYIFYFLRFYYFKNVNAVFFIVYFSGIKYKDLVNSECFELIFLIEVSKH